MITIIAGTNRPNSNTKIIANYYSSILKEIGEDSKFVTLELLNGMTISEDMYNEDDQEPIIQSLQDEIFIPSDKLIIVVPEYNGGIPGIFKFFIDAISVRKYSESFKGKKACLVGVSNGRAGNSRGLDYLTNALNYLGIQVFNFKLPISSLATVITDNVVTNDDTQKAIKNQIQGFLKF